MPLSVGQYVIISLNSVSKNDLQGFSEILHVIYFTGLVWFFIYGLKCSQPLRLQYYFIINISGRNQLFS